jgi:hypothetical protein
MSATLRPTVYLAFASHHAHRAPVMTAPTLPIATARPATPRPAASRARLLGLAGMLASPLMLVEGIRYGFGQSRMDPWTSLGGAVYMLGALASVVALRRARASGDGRLAAGLHVVQVALMLAAAAWSAAYVVTGPSGFPAGPLWTIGDAAWPLTHLSMLVLAYCTVSARRLPAWQRWAPVLPGLALPVFFALAAIFGRRPPIGASFGVLTTLGFLALGWAAYSLAARE